MNDDKIPTIENDNNQPDCDIQEAARPQQVSLLEQLAKILSTIFTPLLAPTYGLILSLNYTLIAPLSDVSTRVWVTLSILAITCMLPVSAIALLFKLGKISDPGVNEQKDRLIPYGITVLCYLIGAIYLTNVNSPQWIPMFMVGGGIAAIVSALVNLRWKISAHGAGMGGLVALVFTIWLNGYGLFDYMAVATIAILTAGLVGASRLILKCHTLPQVLVGTLNGFFWVFLMTI